MRKFFEAENLAVDIIFTRSSVKHLDELKTGSVYDVGHQAVDHIIRAVEGGSDLFAFLGLTKPNYSLIVGADIQSFADLRGKKTWSRWDLNRFFTSAQTHDAGK